MDLTKIISSIPCPNEDCDASVPIIPPDPDSNTFIVSLRCPKCDTKFDLDVSSLAGAGQEPTEEEREPTEEERERMEQERQAEEMDRLTRGIEWEISVRNAGNITEAKYVLRNLPSVVDGGVTILDRLASMFQGPTFTAGMYKDAVIKQTIAKSYGDEALNGMIDFLGELKASRDFPRIITQV